MLKGFKDFIAQGNVIDLAVAVVIGAVFAKVIDALVNSVIMPGIAMVFGGKDINFDTWLQVGQMQFGVLLTAIVNFVLVAAAIYFVVVVPMNKMIEHRNRRLGIVEEDAVEPEIALLTEIRDALVDSKPQA